MFRSKSDVDRYASKILNQSKTQQKKSSEGLRIAKLYFDIKEYDCAQNYLASFLSENPNDPLGWKLLGEIHENSDKDWSKAIDCYARYYELDSQACAILLKICSCFKNFDKNFDKAIKWIEKTEKVYPYAKQVIELKEKIWNSKLDAKIDWEGYLRRAIDDNPNDEELKLKLVQCFFDQQKYTDAVEFILKVEIGAFNMMSMAWYDCIIPLIEDSLDKTSHLAYLMLLNQKFFLLIEQRDNQAAQDVLIKLDSSIKQYADNTKLDILNEIKAQFFYQCGLFLINSDESMLCNISFIISSFKSKPNQLKKATKTAITKLDEQLNEYAHLTSCFRYTLIGHWLKRASINDQLTFIDEIKKYCSNHDVKKSVLSRIYDDTTAAEAGFLRDSTDFEIPNSEYLFVDLLTLDYADKICLGTQSYNLKLIIWYSLIQLYKYDLDSPRLYVPNSGSIPYGVENLNYTVWESISALDLEVFLYATLTQSYSFNSFKSSKTAAIQPFWLQKHLCTSEQSTWWFNCIKQLETRNLIEKQQTSSTSNSKITQLLNNGVEILRLKKACSKQMNFQICAKTAIYLQNRVNSVTAEETAAAAAGTFYAKADYELLPANEKFKYLNLYATQYWCYVANYIKITSNFSGGDFNFEESFSQRLSLETSSKAQKSYFFDVLNPFAELFDNEQFNYNIYQLALMYLANKKISENDFTVVYDLVKELKFDMEKCNDKIEYKLAKYFKSLSEKVLLNRKTEKEDDDYRRLADLCKEKLFLTLEFIEKYKQATSGVVAKSPKTPSKTPEKPSVSQKHEQIILDLSPVVVVELSPNKTAADQSVYRSANTSENLSMQTANETLATASKQTITPASSFEMSKNEDESLIIEPKAELTKAVVQIESTVEEAIVIEPKAEPAPPVVQIESTVEEAIVIEQQEPRMDMQQIIERIKESKSIKINLYRDLLVNQFNTINKQRSQIKEEMCELHNVIEKIRKRTIPH